MIDLYTWTTPNGRKVSIMLEELGEPYNVHPINIGEGDQHKPEFLAISPNNKIPAIHDGDAGVSIMESAAIMVYLAEKHDRFLPSSGKPRAQTMQWLMWQMGGLGPMLGQAHHFLHFNKGASEYAENRYAEETRRLYGVLDRQLADTEFMAGEYSIADMASWPWISRYEWQGIELAEFANVQRWYKKLLARDAVQKGYHVPKKMGDIPQGD